MNQAEMILSHEDDLPESYFDEFMDEIANTDVMFADESREVEPSAGIEWMMVPAIAVVLLKPFFDAFVKRAADDFANATYPRVKDAVTRLVTKVFIRNKVGLTVYSTSPKKVQNPDVLIFAVYATTHDGKVLKFVFRENWTEQEYETAVHCLFDMLRSHCGASNSGDILSQQIARLSNPSKREVFLLYDSASQTWNVIEPKRLLTGSNLDIPPDGF